MAEQAPNSVAILMGVTSLLSLAALFYLFQKHIDGRPLLDYAPRVRVPWGPATALAAVAMPLFGVVLFLMGMLESNPEADAVTNTPAPTMDWGAFVFMIGFVFGLGAWIVAFHRADARDLGLPANAKQALQDIGLGFLTTLAAMVPIYVVQLTLVLSLDINTKHPLVEQIEADKSSSMLVLGVAMAVIAAPLFEEFTFRCLFQGWLEKREDEQVGYLATQRPVIEPEWVKYVEGTELPGEQSADQANFELTSNSSTEETSAHLASYKSGRDELTVEGATIDHEAIESDELGNRPIAGWLPALPHGWTPILISGVAFGLAHLGHGVAPVPLVLFGIVLGYLYQRTHRLLPCIAAHMLFNGYSMVLLWLQLD